MDELLKNVSTGSWWVSVVVVGLFINLASSFLVKWLDGAGSAVSAWRRSKSERRRERFNTEVARLVAEPELLAHFFQDETRWRLRSVVVFLMTVLLGVMVQALYGGPGSSLNVQAIVICICSVGMIAAFKLEDRADDLQRIVKESRKVATAQEGNTLGSSNPG